MVSPYQCVAHFVIMMSCLMSCQGVNVALDDEDLDDIWPVLCPPETYYSRTKDLCLICKQCPINKIITSPCLGFHDTKCGPFYDFKDTQPTDLESLFEDKLKNALHNMESNKHVSPDLETTSWDKPSHESLEFTDSEWKSLTISLFVFLSLFAITIFIVGVYLFRRKITNEKKLVCQYSPAPADV